MLANNPNIRRFHYKIQQNKNIYNRKLKLLPSKTSNNAGKSLLTMKQNFKARMIDLFLPKGYPTTVDIGYLKYSQWQILHNVTSTVTGVLSTQSLLYAMGLGAGSIPMAAALNWIIKDGLGQLGGVIYVSLMNNKFDSNPKRHRMWSAISMQLASLLELFSPCVPHLFLPLASVSNIGKNISWLAASATRAQMNSSFALKDNLGDITAKSGSQSTLAAVLGTMLGVVITPLIGNELPNLVLGFLPFSYLSLYSIHKANQCVITKNFNLERIDLLLDNYFKEHKLLSPSQIADKESYFLKYKSKIYGNFVDVNPSLSNIKFELPAETMIKYLNQNHFFITKNDKQFYLFLATNIDNETKFKAYYLIYYYYYLELNNNSYNNNKGNINSIDDYNSIKNEHKLNDVIKKLYQMKWNMDTSTLFNTKDSIQVIPS